MSKGIGDLLERIVRDDPKDTSENIKRRRRWRFSQTTRRTPEQIKHINANIRFGQKFSERKEEIIKFLAKRIGKKLRVAKPALLPKKYMPPSMFPEGLFQ